MYIVAGLVRDAHQARGLIRALADAAFEREDINMTGGPIVGLVSCGVPEGEAHILAEGIRRGGSIVAVKADDEMEAEQAALIMSRHGGGRIYRDRRAAASYRGPERRRRMEKPFAGFNRRAA